MANQIYVIGVGPGDPQYITPAALKLIEDADVLVGGERLLASFADLDKEQYYIGHNLSQVVEFICGQYKNKKVAVLASGDPTFFGILEYLKRHFDRTELLVVPGISSIQLACARLGLSWHDAAFYSVHGRGMDGLADLVRARDKVIILTDPHNTPAVICHRLTENGVTSKRVYVCEDLSYEDEQVSEYELNNVPPAAGSSGCVLIIVSSE